MTMLTSGTFHRTAVSSSWAFMKNAPSPLMLTTGAPGTPIFTPMACGSAAPMQPKSSVPYIVRGAAKCSLSYP